MCEVLGVTTHELMRLSSSDFSLVNFFFLILDDVFSFVIHITTFLGPFFLCSTGNWSWFLFSVVIFRMKEKRAALLFVSR